MGNKTKIRVIDLKKLKGKITQILEKEKIDLIFEEGLIEQLKKLKPKKTKCIFSAYYLSRLADDIKDMCLEVIKCEEKNVDGGRLCIFFTETEILKY